MAAFASAVIVVALGFALACCTAAASPSGLSSNPNPHEDATIINLSADSESHGTICSPALEMLSFFQQLKEDQEHPQPAAASLPFGTTQLTCCPWSITTQ